MANEESMQYREILFPSEGVFSNYSCEGSRGIGPLSLVNIFIGANNSGKSRLLRSLFALKDFSFTTDKHTARPIYDLIEGLKPEFDAVFLDGLTSLGNISSEHLTQVLSLDPDFISPNAPINKLARPLLEKLAALIAEEEVVLPRDVPLRQMRQALWIPGYATWVTKALPT
jgi:hypothetical protein